MKAFSAGSVRLKPKSLIQGATGRRAASWMRRRHARHLPMGVRALNLDDLILDIPDIDGDLRSVEAALGATFNDDGVAMTFGNGTKALQALEAGVVLMDRSHWGRLRVAGEDRLQFLHNQSTNDFTSMVPGQGCDTVLVTATARTLDLATILVLDQGLLVLTHPLTRQQLLERFNKYIFPADKVKVMDVSSKTCMLTLLGPESDAVLNELGAGSVVGKPYGSHILMKLRDRPVMVAVTSGLSHPGYTLIADETVAGDLYGALASKGCIPAGEQEWQQMRILDGRPEPGCELTQDFNPLEAGLYSAVSVSKGCYIGQETLAKLANLDAVKQQLWGVSLQAPCAIGAEISSGGQKVGVVTSVTQDINGGAFALGYIKCKSKGAQLKLEGSRVEVDGAAAEVVGIPFASRVFSGESAEAASSTASSEELDARAEAARRQKAEADAAEAAAREEKLKVEPSQPPHDQSSQPPHTTTATTTTTTSSVGPATSESSPGVSEETGASERGGSDQQAQGGEARVRDRWRWIVDPEMQPFRRGRVVDVRAIQLHGRPDVLHMQAGEE